jgi:hypothetical protein
VITQEINNLTIKATMLLADTCAAALESLSDLVGLDMAKRMVFAKMRHHMIERDGQHLNLKIVEELNPVLGPDIMRMNDEYLEAKGQARQDGTFAHTIKWRGEDVAWTPPNWRAPRWGIDGKLMDANADHNNIMDQLRDSALKTWKEEKAEDLSLPQLTVCLTALASHSVYCLPDEKANKDTQMFDGEP